MSNGFRNFIMAVCAIVGTFITVANTVYTQDKMLEEGIKTQEILRG